jgi:C4-dicarboxylate transporter, DctM subunit
LFLELKQISPPEGHQFVLIRSIWDGNLSGVILGTIPFHQTMFVLLALVNPWSELALWLPYHMSR